jgi:hypothetical protein
VVIDREEVTRSAGVAVIDREEVTRSAGAAVIDRGKGGGR